jgi:hypothetical protein
LRAPLSKNFKAGSMATGLSEMCFCAGLDRFGGRHPTERINNQTQLIKEQFALLGRKRIQDPIVNALGHRIRTPKNALAFFRQLDSIRTRIFFGAAALQQALLQHPADDVRESRAVDTGAVDQASLADAFIVRHSQKDGILAGRQICIFHLSMKNFTGALACAVQHMQRRSGEPICFLITLHWGPSLPLVNDSFMRAPAGHVRAIMLAKGRNTSPWSYQS